MALPYSPIRYDQGILIEDLSGLIQTSSSINLTSFSTVESIIINGN